MTRRVPHLPVGAFVSYARSDGSDFANELRERVKKEAPDIDLWRDIEDMLGGRSWWAQITEAIDHVQYLILVMTPGAVASRVCADEWRYARNRGVDVLPVRVPDRLIDFGTLPHWMSKVHFYDLDSQWPRFLQHLRSPSRMPRVPFMAPDLPEGFVERPREFDVLLRHVLRADRGHPVAITTALHGAGGFGKSTLAAALCRHDAVLSEFDDGILWVTLGQTPNLRDSLIKLYAGLTGDHPAFVDAEEAATMLAQQLENRNCLVVIDDAWDASHLEPFLRGGKECIRLITTRRSDIIPTRAQRVRVDEMESDEAVAMLAARLPPCDVDTEVLRHVAARLGEWPLLLDLAAGAIRGRQERGEMLPQALAYVNAALGHAGVTAFDCRNATDRGRSVNATMRLSLDQLERPEQEACFAVAIFPEDVDVPLEVLGKFWGLDAFETDATAERLANSSLVRLNLSNRTLGLHDVVQKYLAEQLTDAASWHAKLVDVFLSKQIGFGDVMAGPVTAGPVSVFDERSYVKPSGSAGSETAYGLSHAYVRRWAAYHLKHAGREAQLRQLLGDFRWLSAKLEAMVPADPAALIADYDYLADPGSFGLLREALRLSANAVGRDSKQFASQVVGRLLASNDPDVVEFRTRAMGVPTYPWFCPQFPSLDQAGGPLLRTLEGHAFFVNSIALTPDGRQAVSGSADGTLKVWDLKAGHLLSTLKGHADCVNAVAVTPDERYVVSASADRTLKIWELATGRILKSMDGHWSTVSAVAVTPGAQAVSASGDRTLKVWDLVTGCVLRTLSGQAGDLKSVAVTADGRQAISGSDDGTVRVWDLGTGHVVRTFEGHVASANAVTLTPDQRHVVSASADRTLKVWDLETGSILCTLEGHASSINTVAATPDGRQVVSGSADRTLRVWDLKTGRVLSTLEGHADCVNAVAVTSDGRQAVSASADGTLKIWDLQASRATGRFERHGDCVNAVSVAPNGRVAVSASRDGTLKVWDLKTGCVLHTLNDHEQHVFALSLTPDGRQAVAVPNDGTLKVWDLETARLLRVLRGDGEFDNAVVVTPDGRHVVAVSNYRRLKVWDLETGCMRCVLEGHANYVNALAVTPDGRRLVSGAADRLLKVWDLATGRHLCTLESHVAEVNGVAVTPDGRQAVSASADRTLKLWDLETGRLRRTLEGHGAYVNAVAVTPNGRWAVSVSTDWTLRLWDLETGMAAAAFTGESDLKACAVAPNGTTVLAGEWSGRLHVLELRFGNRVQ